MKHSKLLIQKIDFITCDIELHDIFGVDLIRETNKEAIIIVISSFGKEILSIALLKYNIHSYILKGSLVKDLNKTLAKLSFETSNTVYEKGSM